MAKPMVWLSPLEQNRFKAWIKDHDGLLTVLGALIVFVSLFYERGSARESKDLDASLRSARDKFTLRSEIGDVLSELNIQSEVLGSVHNIVNRTPGLSIGLDEEQALIRVDLLKRDFVGNKETYLIASDLLHSLPNKPSGQTLDDKLKQILVVHHRALDDYSNLTDLINGSDPNGSDRDTNGAIRRSLLGAAMVETEPSNQAREIDRFTTMVLDEAEVQNRHQEAKLKWTTYSTFATFVLGWTLSFLGKLLKIPAMGGGLEG